MVQARLEEAARGRRALSAAREDFERVYADKLSGLRVREEALADRAARQSDALEAAAGDHRARLHRQVEELAALRAAAAAGAKAAASEASAREERLSARESTVAAREAAAEAAAAARRSEMEAELDARCVSRCNPGRWPHTDKPSQPTNKQTNKQTTILFLVSRVPPSCPPP